MRRVVGHPRSDFQKRAVVTGAARDVEAPRTIRSPHHAPRIPGRLARVQEDRADRAAARSFLVFVSPSPFVSERAAAEKVWFFFGSWWIVDQHHQNLAAIIFRRPFVVVPLLLRRIDAVAYKNQLGIHRNVFGLRAREGHEIIGEFERFCFIWSVDAQLSFRVGFHTDERNWLPETSFRARAFQAHPFKLFGGVHRGQFPAARAGAATFQTIVRKKLDVRAQGAFANRARRSPRPLGYSDYGERADYQSCDDDSHAVVPRGHRDQTETSRRVFRAHLTGYEYVNFSAVVLIIS